MARVYADDIDKLRIPMPASSNWGDPKGRVDPEVLRAASWGTDFDVDARRNSIAQALMPPPQAQAPTAAQQYLQAIGWGGTEQQYYDSLGGPQAAIAQRNAILGGGGSMLPAVVPQTGMTGIGAPAAPQTGMSGIGAPAAQPTQDDYLRTMMQLDWGPNGPPPEFGIPWSPEPFKDTISGGASGSAAGTGATGGDTG
jgi:hypothetical protein